MKIKNSFLTTAMFCMIIAISANTKAALLSLDDPTYGTDSITRDTITGLEWLDLTHTVGMSFEDVEAELGSGGQFEGFSTAYISEVQQLIMNGGWAYAMNTTFREDQPKYDLAVSLAELLGVTFSTIEPRAGAYGFVREFFTGSNRYYGGIFTLDNAQNPLTSRMTFTNASSSPSSSRGVWLYRAVPEPNALFLSLFSSVGLLLRRNY